MAGRGVAVGVAARRSGGGGTYAGECDGSRGSVAEKAHFDYKAALKARDARAAEPNEIAEGAKTAGRAEVLRKETDELYRKGDEERVGFELQLAGSRYGKAAHVLLIDYDNDVEKFRSAESRLFSTSTGAMGLPSMCAAGAKDSMQMSWWRKMANLSESKKQSWQIPSPTRRAMLPS